MVIATDIVARKYLDVVAAQEIAVDFPLFDIDELDVYYGIGSTLAELDVDYTLELGEDFDTFNITPLTALTDKIDDLIAADATETNFIVVRRRTGSLTDATPDAVRYTPFLSREIERLAMRMQEIEERINRSIKFDEKYIGSSDLLTVEELEPSSILQTDETGTKIVTGPFISTELLESAAIQSAAIIAAVALANAALDAATEALGEANLGDAAVLDVGTTAGTVAAGDDARFAAALTKADADQVITGGARVTSLDQSTKSSGTFTPDPGDRPIQRYINNGAHTLAPGSNHGYYILDITNGASAGAITTSGWTKKAGDSFTTANGHKFRCSCVISDAGSSITVQALQ